MIISIILTIIIPICPGDYLDYSNHEYIHHDYPNHEYIHHNYPNHDNLLRCGNYGGLAPTSALLPDDHRHHSYPDHDYLDYPDNDYLNLPW